MSPAFLVLGLVLLAATVVDLLWTALWVDGGSGPISSKVTSWLWRGLRRLGGERSRVLSLAGPAILVATLLLWVVLLWAGWTFVFAGSESALVDTSDGTSVSWPGRIYYVAYSMFTMGNGDFRPVGGWWQVATALTTASGMMLVTMAVSYVLSVLGSVTQKRSFAGAVTGLGRRSEHLVVAGWDGKDLRRLDLPLSALSSQASSLADQHKAYPILHYYHSESGHKASAVAVAVLDDALTLLRFGVPDQRCYNAAVVADARASIDGYLATMKSAFIEPADEPPPAPDLRLLRDAGVPTVAGEQFAEAVADLADRRRNLLGVVRADAWGWPPLRS